MEFEFNIGETVYDILGNRYTIIERFMDSDHISDRDRPTYKVDSKTSLQTKLSEGVLYSVKEYRKMKLESILEEDISK